MKRRHLLLGGALALAAGLAAFGDKTPDDEVAQPVARAARPQLPARAVQTAAKGGDVAILRLLPREALVGDGAGEFKAGGNDLFASRDWTPPPPPPPPAPTPPPASAPPLPFTFIGKSVSGGVWEVYLARGDRTWLVHDKDTIDGTYRVDAIAPPVLTLTYLPLNQVQQLNIGVFD